MDKVILLGDSLTAGYGIRFGKGWAYQVASFYPEKIFYNRGILGDTTDHMLTRARIYLEEIQPDQLVFLGGSNDLLLGRTPQDIFDSIQKLHQMCSECHTKLILMQCPPISHHPGPYAWFQPSEMEILLGKFQILREKVQDYSRMYHIICVDLPRILSDLDENDMLLEDGIHLTEKAHQRIASWLFREKIID